MLLTLSFIRFFLPIVWLLKKISGFVGLKLQSIPLSLSSSSLLYFLPSSLCYISSNLLTVFFIVVSQLLRLFVSHRVAKMDACFDCMPSFSHWAFERRWWWKTQCISVFSGLSNGGNVIIIFTQCCDMAFEIILTVHQPPLDWFMRGFPFDCHHDSGVHSILCFTYLIAPFTFFFHDLHWWPCFLPSSIEMHHLQLHMRHHISCIHITICHHLFVPPLFHVLPSHHSFIHRIHHCHAFVCHSIIL